MAAREIGAKARVSYLDTNDIDSLDVSVARPLPVVDAAGNIAIAATTTAVNAVKTAVDLTTAAVSAGVTPPASAADLAVVAVATTTTVLVAASATRTQLTFYNAGANPIYFGPTPVLLATGIPLPAGGYWSRDVAGGARLAWSGIVAAATENMRIETVG